MNGIKGNYQRLPSFHSVSSQDSARQNEVARRAVGEIPGLTASSYRYLTLSADEELILNWLVPHPRIDEWITRF